MTQFVSHNEKPKPHALCPQGSVVTSWPPAFPALKEEESSEVEVTAAAPAQEQEPVPSELDGVRTPEPLEDFPKREDQEGSSPETSLPYKWVVEAANLLIPAVESGLSEALDLIESVMLVTGLPVGPEHPYQGALVPLDRRPSVCLSSR